MIDWRAVAILAGLACSSPAIAQQRQSVFTKLKAPACRLVEEVEEGTYFLQRCKGHAGWQLDWDSSDLRDDLTLIARDGRKTELGITQLVADGAFNSVGQTIEWRGRAVAKPDTLIVRVNVANHAAPGGPDISKLAVVRLTGTPCVIAIVEPGQGQNQKARKLADRAARNCMSR